MPEEIEITDLRVNVREPNTVRLHPTIVNRTDEEINATIGVWFNGNFVRDYGHQGLSSGVTESDGYGAPITTGIDLGEGQRAELEVCVEITDYEKTGRSGHT